MTRPLRNGQVWASNHSGDRARGIRQRRMLVNYDTRYAFLATVEEGAQPPSTRVLRPSTRVLRTTRGSGIKGHRLVEEAP